MKQLSKKDLAFIRSNIALPPDELAQRTGKNIELIKAAIAKFKADAPIDAEKTIVARKLAESVEWEFISEEFDDRELDYFKQRYSKLMAQLKDDVTPTEETQIMYLVKYEILKHRNLSDVKQMGEDIKRVEKLLEEGYDKGLDEMTDTDKQFLLSLENQISAIRVARQAKAKELNDYDQRSSAIMKELKTLRDQRFTKIENEAGSVVELFKKLANAEEKKRQARILEMMRIATEKEKAKLSQLHTFKDGSVDQPLLTPDTVGLVT